MSDREEIVEVKQNYWSYVKRQFKKNKRALFSMYFVGFLTVIALFADFIANEKPIYCKYKGETYFPVLKSYAVDLGFSTWPKELRNAPWDELEYDSVVFPPVPYSPSNLDWENGQYASPFAEQKIKSKRWHHWLGTLD